jgi:hypothetical protein
MSYSLPLFIAYLLLVIAAIYVANRKAEAKRAVIRKCFNLEDSQVRSTSHQDPRLRRLTMLAWSLAFVVAGILLFPVVVLGDYIWVQAPLIELLSLIVGAAAIRVTGMMNWYLECYITDFKSYYLALLFTAFAIVLGNGSYAVPMMPLGLIAQAAAFIFMLPAIYLLVRPILTEEGYYEEVGSSS